MFVNDEDPNLTEDNLDETEPEGEQVAEESSPEETEPETAQEEEKAFAEKYGVPFHDEANLVKGYKELQAMATRNAQENAEMRSILKTLAERQGATATTAAEEPDIETYYADAPEILPLAKELKHLRQKVVEQERTVGQRATVEAARFAEEFFEANPILKTNPAVLREYLEDLNDRLPGYTFNDVYQGALKGDTMEPTYVPEFKRKMVAAFKAVTRATSEKADLKKAAAQEKVKKMSDTLPPKDTEGKQKTADLKKMTYKEIREHIKRNYNV